MHYRQSLRQNIKAVLEALPGLSGRCHINRVGPVAQSDMPAVCIYTRRSSTVRHIDQWRSKELCWVEIEVYTGGSDAEVQAAATDAICLQIESALLKDQTLSGVCEDIEHKCDEIETLIDDTDVTVHAVMKFRAIATLENTSDDEGFETVGVTWDVAPVDGVTDASDEIALEQ